MGIVSHEDDEILVKMPKVMAKGIVSKAQVLKAVDPDFPEYDGVFEDFYTFTRGQYSDGWRRHGL
jgi:hypothetical protein